MRELFREGVAEKLEARTGRPGHFRRVEGVARSAYTDYRRLRGDGVLRSLDL